MRDPEPRVSWADVDAEEALRVGEAFIASHPIRLNNFVERLDRAGFDASLFDWSEVSQIEQAWSWLCEHTELPTWEGDSPAQEPSSWVPELGGYRLEPDWPPWCALDVDHDALELIYELYAAWGEILCQQASAVWMCVPAGDAFPEEIRSSPYGMSLYQVNKVVLYTPIPGRWFAVNDTMVVRYFSNCALGQIPDFKWQQKLVGYSTPRADEDDGWPPDVERADDFPVGWFEMSVDSYSGPESKDMVDEFVYRLNARRGVLEAYREDREVVFVRFGPTRSLRSANKVIQQVWEQVHDQ